jgi:hypothetical protein
MRNPIKHHLPDRTTKNYIVMMNSSKSGTSKLDELLEDLTLGRGVKRSKHELMYEGIDVTDAFVEVLLRTGFMPVTVSSVDLQPGERIPAFYIKDGIAYFGWIFYEKFTRTKFRKLWGSVVRNQKGDWAIQISSRKNHLLYAALGQKREMDLDHPTDF